MNKKLTSLLVVACLAQSPSLLRAQTEGSTTIEKEHREKTITKEGTGDKVEREHTKKVETNEHRDRDHDDRAGKLEKEEHHLKAEEHHLKAEEHRDRDHDHDRKIDKDEHKVKVEKDEHREKLDKDGHADKVEVREHTTKKIEKE